MPQRPLEEAPPPLSTGGGPQGNSSSNSTTSVASRSPAYDTAFTNDKSRSQSALNLGSILNPVSLSSVSAPPPPPPRHSSSTDDRCYQQRHPQPPSTQGMPAVIQAHAQQQQRQLSNDSGVLESQTRSPHGYTNGTSSETLVPIFSQDATVAAEVVTKTANKRGSNSSNGSRSGSSGGGDMPKQLPHRKRTKDKSTPSTIASVAEGATLKWQPVETPQDHFGEQPHYVYASISALPPTNGHHRPSRPPPPPPLPSSSPSSSAAGELIPPPPPSSATTPADVRQIPTMSMHAPPIEFINSTPGYHPQNSNGSHHPHYYPQQQEAPPPQSYDTLPRPNSAPMYTVPSPTGNHYYYYHYPTPESPSNSSSTTPPFFSTNNDIQQLPPPPAAAAVTTSSTANTRKRSLPVDHSNQPKRVRQNSDVVAPFPMPPNTATIHPHHQHPQYHHQHQPPPPYPETYMYHPPQQYQHQHQHNPYLPPQPYPAYYLQASHQPPPSMDPNAMPPHYIQQQPIIQPSARPPPPPPPTPPIKEKKPKKTKTASTAEPGKPAKKGRPLKNPPSAAASKATATTQPQHDAGSSSLKPKVCKMGKNNNSQYRRLHREWGGVCQRFPRSGHTLTIKNIFFFRNYQLHLTLLLIQQLNWRQLTNQHK
ncbi:hypothetical protein BDB00DRAFT_559356 [Zychaea mexicana]|uniref:uncharacterized protein n=1 Tax=Zychaea mexicana TaxID=64656 RepID=UPI0022FE70BB|nr:uncharacterized protein BDB00DRAFT_559356 [Zychaea mexicana]KAI9490370.1 hypothetical protein BDB00DRAFT_559356 [Zychaea mexicana]